MADYDLRSLSLPVLTGRSLRLFARALDNPLTRGALLPALLKQGGLGRMRDLCLTETPTYYPLRPVRSPAERALEPAEVEAALAAPARSAEAERIAPGPRMAPGIFRTARDYAGAYRSGTATPEQVAEKVLSAIAASDAGAAGGAHPPLHAFIANDREDILAQARAATARLAAGRPLSILDGVPVAVKDELDQVPYPTTFGTTFMATGPAPQDATVVARLRAAGALLIGKANMHEIGIDVSGFNAHYGTVRNPYDPMHDPGGSSNGPAAAVAAGFCPIAAGLDGGGSIRVPATLCGLVGLKATFGRISMYGSEPLQSSVNHVGPIGATVEDVALAYGIMAGPDPRDPYSQAQPPVSLAGWNVPDLSGVRLGIYRPWFEHAAPAIVAACRAMVDRFAAAGAQICDVVIPDLDAIRLAHVLVILTEILTSMARWEQDRGKLAPSVRVSMALAYGLTSEDFVKANQVRTRALAAFDAVLADVDAIITPATAITSPPILPGAEKGGWSNLSVSTELMRFIVPGNFTGLPAIVFPVGYDGSGLPIGMQAMGRHWEEPLLLRIAGAAERSVERRRPKVFYEIL